MLINRVHVLCSSTTGPGKPRERISWPGQGERNSGRGHAADPRPGNESLLLPHREQASRRGAVRDRPEGERDGRAAGVSGPELRKTPQLQVRHRRSRLQWSAIREVCPAFACKDINIHFRARAIVQRIFPVVRCIIPTRVLLSNESTKTRICSRKYPEIKVNSRKVERNERYGRTIYLSL